MNADEGDLQYVRVRAGALLFAVGNPMILGRK